MRASLLKFAFAGLTSLLVAGCPQILGLFGATADEQIQLRQLRGMQQAVSTATNPELNFLVQAVSEVLAVGLPTFYGYDLTPYLGSVAWPPLPAANKDLDPPIFCKNNPNDPHKEVGLIQSRDRRQRLTFNFNECELFVQLKKPMSLTYKIALEQSRIPGVTGSLNVTTSNQIQFRAGKPTDVKGQPYVFGRHYIATQPTSVDINVRLTRMGSELADVRVGLAQSSGQFAEVLPEITVSGSLPRIDFDLRGRFTSGTLSMSGTMGVNDGKQRQDLQVVSLSSSARGWRIQAEGDVQRYRIELQSTEGKLSGTITTTFPEYQRQIVKIEQTGDKPTIKYIDNNAAEPWR